MTAWWAPRQPGERTTQYLGRVLDIVGLPEMARRARQGHFDDYFCPPDVDDGLNIHRLVAELGEHRDQSNGNRRKDIQALIDGAKDGEFDGTKAESEEWARSAQGRATFERLLGVDYGGPANEETQ